MEPLPDREAVQRPFGGGVRCRMLGEKQEEEVSSPRIKIDFTPGDIVKIKEGTFESFEGSIDGIDESTGKISVLIEIFGRSTPVELEYWQVERV